MCPELRKDITCHSHRLTISLTFFYCGQPCDYEQVILLVCDMAMSTKYDGPCQGPREVTLNFGDQLERNTIKERSPKLERYVFSLVKFGLQVPWEAELTKGKTSETGCGLIGCNMFLFLAANVEATALVSEITFPELRSGFSLVWI